MPNVADCVVQDKKLTDYLMNFDYEQGRSKAIFFLRCGFSEQDLSALRHALQMHPAANPVSEHSRTAFGEKYVVTCTLLTPNGRNPCIITVWLDEGSAAPRLITAYPK